MKNSIRALVVAGAAVAAFLPAVSGASASAAAIPPYEKPKVFGTKFQPDPGHDFSKRLHPRRNGILRGWITDLRGNVAEYEPIRWKLGKDGRGRFVGPPEYDVMAYSSRLSSNVRFLSAYGCKVAPTGATENHNGSLGAKRCARDVLVKRTKKHGPRPALITVYRGEIVKVQEIFVV
ncbi:hypothetical protein [Spongiactinospora sp. TRM90649]|uniref:hypothetical protein n=1 Tax=Spongiactinospora sp. TRM90649 TaxID=3031114 RepID=UPI0023F7BD89|nr:hypothetical protein [Spongiactinospora sp. TRM90649]MDF5753851.1 hypothetical protein [Spongiactinospora sp. TRM90649]